MNCYPTWCPHKRTKMTAPMLRRLRLHSIFPLFKIQNCHFLMSTSLAACLVSQLSSTCVKKSA